MTSLTAPLALPDLASIERTRSLIREHIIDTPVHQWSSPELSARLGDMQVVAKLELFQVTGTFKPRSALANAMSLDADQLRRGLVAVSAGNHAIATAYAA